MAAKKKPETITLIGAGGARFEVEPGDITEQQQAQLENGDLHIEEGPAPVAEAKE